MSKQLWGNRKPPSLLSFPYTQGNDGGREASRIREVDDYIRRHNSAITELKTKLGLSDSDVPITVTGTEGRPSTFDPDIFKGFVNDLNLITNIRWPTSTGRPYSQHAGKNYWQSSETPVKAGVRTRRGRLQGDAPVAIPVEYPSPRCHLRYSIHDSELASALVTNNPAAQQWLKSKYQSQVYPLEHLLFKWGYIQEKLNPGMSLYLINLLDVPKVCR